MTLQTVPLLRNILCGLVIIAITIGGLAYMGGDLTGTAMGASALTGVPTRIMAPILGVIVLIVLLFVGDAVKYLEKLLSVCVTLMAIVFLMTMLIVRPDFGELLRGCIPTVPKGGLMTCLSLIGTGPLFRTTCSCMLQVPREHGIQRKNFRSVCLAQPYDDHRWCYHRFHYDHIRSGYARHER